MSASVRLFVGMLLPGEATAHLESVVAPLRTDEAAAAGVRWIPAKRWHVTLAFLGNAEESRVAGLSRALGRAVRDVDAPGDMRLRGSGQFDRTLWVGVDAPASVHALAQAVQDGMRDAGVDIERRPWRPHVTVARARAGSEALEQALDGYRGPVWVPASVTLVESVTGPRPRYVVRHEAGLR